MKHVIFYWRDDYEAQRKYVEQFLNQIGGKVIATYFEPNFQVALDRAKQEGASLLIAET